MSVQLGFESEDPVVIKKARGTAKGRVTNFVNRLPFMLKKEIGGNFRHDQIDEADVSDVVTKLEESLQHFLDLQTRFMEFRVELVDKGEEDKLLNDEEVYVNRVMETYCSAVASHNSYKKEIKLFEAADAQAALKIVLNVAKGAANEVISSEDEKIKKLLRKGWRKLLNLLLLRH